MMWEVINLVVNWTIAIGFVALFGYACLWTGVVWARGHSEPEPCGRKHRDEL